MVLEYAKCGCAQGIEYTNAPDVASATSVQRASEDEVSDRLSRTRACWRRMVTLLALRLIIQILTTSVLEESWLLWSVRFACVSVAIFDGARTTYGVQDILFQIFGVEPSVQTLQVPVVVLMILTQIQDFTLRVTLGSGLWAENS